MCYVSQSGKSERVVGKCVEVHSERSVMPLGATVQIFFTWFGPTLVTLTRTNIKAQILAAVSHGHLLPSGYMLGECLADGIVWSGGEGDKNAFGNIEVQAGDALELVK